MRRCDMHPDLDSHKILIVKRKLRIVEVLFVFIFTYLVCGFGLATVLPNYIHIKIPMIRGWESHLPMLLIPYIWYRFRVVPILSEKDKGLWSWRKENSRLLLKICIWYVPVLILLNISSLHTPFHSAFGSVSSAISTITFQSVFVGLSEEMMTRPALQLPLSNILDGGFQIGKIKVRYSVLITAVLFGGAHMINLIYQPFITTLFQSIYAFLLGVLIGFYYGRTHNYLGAVILHGINDGIGPILILVSSMIHLD